jgi:hypothetical protein
MAQVNKKEASRSPFRVYFKGANRIDELCPPNPKEFDSATFTSHLSFFDPTNTLTSCGQD